MSPTPYKVVWTRTAKMDHLAAIVADRFAAGKSTADVNDALNVIERFLSNDPRSFSESRDVDERVIMSTPLSVIFRIEEANKRVVIVRVVDSQRKFYS